MQKPLCGDDAIHVRSSFPAISVPSRHVGVGEVQSAFPSWFFFLRMNYVHFLPWTQEEGKLQERAGGQGRRRGWVESPSPAPQTPLCSETSPRSTSALGKEREKGRKEGNGWSVGRGTKQRHLCVEVILKSSAFSFLENSSCCTILPWIQYFPASILNCQSGFLCPRRVQRRSVGYYRTENQHFCCCE